jgi:hypothetical protein
VNQKPNKRKSKKMREMNIKGIFTRGHEERGTPSGHLGFRGHLSFRKERGTPLGHLGFRGHLNFRGHLGFRGHLRFHKERGTLFRRGVLHLGT